jgi:hypothetical protein
MMRQVRFFLSFLVVVVVGVATQLVSTLVFLWGRCQPFLGLWTTANTGLETFPKKLFFEHRRIIAENSDSACVLENVS